MMGPRLPSRSGDEHDAISGWRRVIRWPAGVRASIKRGMRRRERRVTVDVDAEYGEPAPAHDAWEREDSA